MNQDPLDTEPASKPQVGESLFNSLSVLKKYAEVLEEGKSKKEPLAARHIPTTLPGKKPDPNRYRDLKHYSDSGVGSFWRAGNDDKPLTTWDYSWRRKQLDQLDKVVEKYADDVSSFDGDVLKRQAYIDKVKKHIQHGHTMKLFPQGITESEIQCNSNMDWANWKSKKERAAEAAAKITEKAVKATEPVNGKKHKVAEDTHQQMRSENSELRARPKSFLREILTTGATMLRDVATKLEAL
jgi:hypothetical protein